MGCHAKNSICLGNCARSHRQVGVSSPGTFLPTKQKTLRHRRLKEPWVSCGGKKGDTGRVQYLWGIHCLWGIAASQNELTIGRGRKPGMFIYTQHGRGLVVIPVKSGDGSRVGSMRRKGPSPRGPAARDPSGAPCRRPPGASRHLRLKRPPGPRPLRDGVGTKRD